MKMQSVRYDIDIVFLLSDKQHTILNGIRWKKLIRQAIKTEWWNATLNLKATMKQHCAKSQQCAIKIKQKCKCERFAF